MPVTPIKHAPRATFDQFWAVVGPLTKRPDFAKAVFTEIWRLATKVGYDPLVFGAQWWHETGGNVDGKLCPGQSADWLNDGNPAGIGHTDGGKVGYLSSTDPLVIARAWVTHLGGYIEGPSGSWLKTTVYKKLDPRWFALLRSGLMGTVTNVEDLGGGTWATQDKATYGGAICGYMRQVLDAAKPDPTTDAPVDKPAEPGMPKSDIYVLVDAGHRETGPGGSDADPTERALTIYLAQDDVRALRAAGYTADLWQAVDGDDNPTDTIGDLSDVSFGIARRIASRPEPLVVFWSDHYNGPHSPFHAIVADGAHLTPAIGTAPLEDTAANNVWDRAFGVRAMAELSQATGSSLFRGKLGELGLMSETECGVGLAGWRLALFAATASEQAHAIRLIFEHGGYHDPAALKDTFSQTCAAAKVKALDAFRATL